MSTPQSEAVMDPREWPRLPVSHFSRFGASSMAAWPTKYVGYPIGIRIAWLAARLRLAPNAVSLVGFLVAVLSLLTAWWGVDHRWLEAFILFVGLQLAYAIDCADGVIARATGRCSHFGAVLDKVMDAMTIIIVPLILTMAAVEIGWIERSDEVPLIMIALMPRLGLAIANWLKSYETGTISDRAAPDVRPNGLVQSASRIVAAVVDAPTYRLGIAISWGFGIFAQFMVVFGCFTLLAFVLYMVKSAREMREPPQV